MSRKFAAIAAACATVVSTGSVFALPAFPGAEGFGANAAGGRGGDVYHVISLADDPTGVTFGTLQYGLLAKHVPAAGRTIVFDVGGTIHLGANTLDIKNIRNVTIAGQTAPSPITIIGNTVQVTSSPSTECGNIILQYVAIRKGLENSGDSLTIKGSGNTHDVMVDHVSASWGEDEVISVAGATNRSENVTVQNSFISESLESGHQFGALIRNNQSEHVSYNHNLFSNNSSRNPRPGTYLGTQLDFEFQNNVIYNWSDRAGYTGGASEAETENVNMNYVGNYLVAGPSTVGGPTTAGAAPVQGGRRNTAFTKDASNDPLNLHFYQSGNKIDWAAGATRDGQDIGWNAFDDWNGTTHSAFPTVDQNASPFAYPTIAAGDSADTAYAKLIASVGAFPYARDATDQRLINELLTYTGTAGQTSPNAAEYNALLAAAMTTRPAGWDTDGDGMPNAWEIARGYNPNLADNNTLTADGYTRLEHYLQTLTAIASWNTDANGDWWDYLNWRGTRPERMDSTANFGPGITAPRIVTLSAPVTVGTLNFDSPTNGYTLAGPGGLTLDVISGITGITVNSGAHTIATPLTLNKDVLITVALPDGAVRFTGQVNATGRAITLAGQGIAHFENVGAASLNVAGGTVRISEKATAAAANGTSVVQSLSIGSSPTNDAAVDLTNNALIVDYGGTSSPLSSIRGWLASGFAGGSWNGAGINSSTAAAVATDGSNPHKTALGYAEASAIGAATFAGQSVDSTSVLIRYTLSGDANLDGVVDTLDFNALAANFGGTDRNWWQGDYNYDGVVDTLDFNALAGNFGASLPQGNVGSFVPEPSAALTMVVAALSIRRRRPR